MKGDALLLAPPIHEPSYSFHSVFTSTPFKFLVEGNAFYVHADLVSRHSKPLDRMINGEMLEAQKGYAVLEETEQSTFDRFARWMYKGYYEPGEPFDQPLDEPSQGTRSIDEEIPSPLRPETVNPDIDIPLLDPDAVIPTTRPLSYGNQEWMSSPSIKKSKKVALRKAGSKHQIEIPTSKSTSRNELKESFIWRKPVIRRTCIDIRPPRSNQKSNEDYSEVFLSHAQLYVFAEKYDIQNLKMLALDNLQNVLTVYTLYEERTGDIVTLLRYIYENTGEPVEGTEDMRTLLRLYMGYEMDTLMKDAGFRNVMIDDGGALLDDFMKMVRKRIGPDWVEQEIRVGVGEWDQ